MQHDVDRRRENKYIEYRPGTLNVIISVPHGGQLKPKSIPNRDFGSRVGGRIQYDHRCSKSTDLPVKTKSDLQTIELASHLSDALKVTTDRQPYVVINHLHRSKLDCNCDVAEAAFGVPDAVDAWHAFHDAIETAITACSKQSVLVLDIHGHTHAEDWIELGYGISEAHLNSGRYTHAQTTMSRLYERLRRNGTPYSIVDLISGTRSLGALLSAKLDRNSVVPSPLHPGPGSGKYFNGGYNVQRYGRGRYNDVDAIQIESPASCRDPATVCMFAMALSDAVAEFVKFYYL